MRKLTFSIILILFFCKTCFGHLGIPIVAMPLGFILLISAGFIFGVIPFVINLLTEAAILNKFFPDIEFKGNLWRSAILLTSGKGVETLGVWSATIIPIPDSFLGLISVIIILITFGLVIKIIIGKYLYIKKIKNEKEIIINITLATFIGYIVSMISCFLLFEAVTYPTLIW